MNKKGKDQFDGLQSQQFAIMLIQIIQQPTVNPQLLELIKQEQ